MSKATAILRAGAYKAVPISTIKLDHDERHLRRKMLTASNGENVLIDLPTAVALEDGDALELENGDLVQIIAAPETLFEITAKTPEHLSRLCWHIGNRHLPAQIERDRILIRHDHVIGAMLTGLGANIKNITAPFVPERGAYHSDTAHSHGHTHGH